MKKITSLALTENLELYEKVASAATDCPHKGTIMSYVERINDVPSRLAQLGVDYLIPYLLITEKTGAFVYEADLKGQKTTIQVVEIYEGLQGTEWRVRHAQLAMQIDDELVDGLSDGVAVTKFVVPFAWTLIAEVQRGDFALPRDLC